MAESEPRLLPGSIVGCLAHVRRKFHDAAKAVKKAGADHVGLTKIQEIYKMEKEIKKLNLDD